MQEVHRVMTHVSSEIQRVFCKLWAQVISANQPAQDVLCWPVQNEASACCVVVTEQKDDCLQHVMQ